MALGAGGRDVGDAALLGLVGGAGGGAAVGVAERVDGVAADARDADARRPVAVGQDGRVGPGEAVRGVGEHDGRVLVALHGVDRGEADRVEVGVDHGGLAGVLVAGLGHPPEHREEAAQVGAPHGREVGGHAHQLAQVGVAAGAVGQAQHREVVAARGRRRLDQPRQAALAEQRPQGIGGLEGRPGGVELPGRRRERPLARPAPVRVARAAAQRDQVVVRG